MLAVVAVSLSSGAAEAAVDSSRARVRSNAGKTRAIHRVSKTPARPAQRPMVLSATAGVNDSYMVGTGVRRVETLNDKIFDAGMSRSVREEYETGQAAYEARERAGLVVHTEERTRFAAMQGLAKRALDGISKIRAKVMGRTVKQSAENANLPRGPIAGAVLAASLYTGRSMNFKVMEGVRMHSRVDLKDRAASLSLPLSQMGLTSTVGYNRDAKVNAQLAQRVTNEVSAVVDSADKGTARLVYSVSF